MKHTLNNQAKRAGIALAVVAAFAVVGIGTAQAASFLSANFRVEPRGEEAGGLTCTWRETGVGASQVVYYACSADAVGALKACVYKNRVIFNSPTQTDIFHNITGGEHGVAVPFLSQKNGQISASTTTPIPTVETGTELCTEPSVEEVVAVRWCGASLTDVSNAVLGATMTELFQEFISGVGSVPSCPDLLQATPTPGGGH